MNDTARIAEGFAPPAPYDLVEMNAGEVPFGELLLYTMRHVQEHAAQLHLFLGQQAAKSLK